MPYHHTHNAKHRTTGFFVVVLLHFLGIYVLANSFAVFNKQKIVTAIEAEIVETPPPEPEEIIPREPTDVQTSIPDFVAPPTLGFAADAIPTSNAIQYVQNSTPTQNENPTFVKARRSSKGLTHPKYPEEAARLGEQGTTEMNLNIAESGAVVSAKIISSSGSTRLDEAIMNHAIRYWKFTPCMDQGRAVSYWYPFTFQWNIENAKKKGTWKSVVAAKDE